MSHFSSQCQARVPGCVQQTLVSVADIIHPSRVVVMAAAVV